MKLFCSDQALVLFRKVYSKPVLSVCSYHLRKNDKNVNIKQFLGYQIAFLKASSFHNFAILFVGKAKLAKLKSHYFIFSICNEIAVKQWDDILSKVSYATMGSKEFQFSCYLSHSVKKFKTSNDALRVPASAKNLIIGSLKYHSSSIFIVELTAILKVILNLYIIGFFRLSQSVQFLQFHQCIFAIRLRKLFTIFNRVEITFNF